MINLQANDPRVGEYSAGGELIRRPQLTLNNQAIEPNFGTILHIGRFFVVVDAGEDTGTLQVKIEVMPAEKEKRA